MAEGTQTLSDQRCCGEAVASVRADGLVTHPSRRPSLAVLLDLSRELSHVLVPVQLRPEFREELYGRLLIEARRQQALQMLALPAGSPALEEPRTMSYRAYLGYGPEGRRWIIGAAAVGSAASLVGLLAYVRSRRHGKVA
jgi:hypothetical protein